MVRRRLQSASLAKDQYSGQNPIQIQEVAAAPAVRERYGLIWLRNRRDYLRAAKGARFHSKALVVQGKFRGDDQAGIASGRDLPPEGARVENEAICAPAKPRFGLTVSKKNGNAVKRNRIKRRLRAALIQAVAPNDAPAATQNSTRRSGMDFVVIAKPNAISAPFSDLINALTQGIAGTRSTLLKSGNSKSKRRHSRSARLFDTGGRG